MGKVFNMRPSTNNDYKHHDSYTNNETQIDDNDDDSVVIHRHAIQDDL